MAEIAIRVETLSKGYRIGLQEEMHDTLTEAMVSWLKALISKYRQFAS